MDNDERGLVRGRRQQRYDREGATSFHQENYGGGGEYRGELEFGGFSDQDFGSQGYGGQGYGDRSYGDPDFGGQAFSRRSSDLDPADPGQFELGPNGYERPSDFGIDPYRDDLGLQHSGAVEYGDVGDARGRGQTFGGHNYDGLGRPGGSDYEPRRAADRRGVGPKDYRRSDARVLEDVCEQLQDDDLLDAGDIEVQCSDGVVTLTGTVGSREARWHAENVASDARGVVDVVNRLAVRRLGVDDTSARADGGAS
jgi:hypothetical protein